jgi:UDP-glucose 4-epimerase
MSVLVTGGAGYIGSIIVEQLVARGERVIVVDDLSKGHREAVAPGALLIKGDIADRALMTRIFREHGTRAVLHMAGRILVGESMTDPSGYFRSNFVNGLALLDAMREAGVGNIIFSSTAAVYGEPREVPISESHPTSPINPYGEAKLMFERALDWYRRAYGLNYVAVRYFNASGASARFGEDHDPESHLIPLVLKAALRLRPPLQIYGLDYPTRDGSCVRDYIHVLDLAEAHICALDRIEQIGAGIFNLGSGTGNTVLEVIEVARKVTGMEIPVENSARREGDPASLVAGSALARTALGWNPSRQDLECIISSAWAWHKRNPRGYGAG